MDTKPGMKEIVVISGKGGTGKTSLVASFAVLAKNAVLADCDVDAADLHLILTPTVRQRAEFRCGREAVIRRVDCVGCGVCLDKCRFGAIQKKDDAAGKTEFSVDPTACEGCGVCVTQCPVKAIDFPERISGAWYVSDTRCGPMVHARLNPGGENSGKLVSKVREVARDLAEKQNADFVIVDGPPGVGCAVIASVSGAALVLVVTEPTMSGAHDMARVLELTRHFNIPAAVCVNKWDLNADMTIKIEAEAARTGAMLAGRVRYDRAVTTAQLQARAIVEIKTDCLGDDVRKLWERIVR